MNYWGDNKGCVSDYFCVVVLIWLLHASKRVFEHWNSYKAIFKIYRPLRFAIGSFVLRKLHLFVSCLNQLSDHKPCHNIWSTVHIHLKDLIDNHLVNTPTNSRPLETIIIDGALVVAVGTPLQTPLVHKNVQLQVSTIATVHPVQRSCWGGNVHQTLLHINLQVRVFYCSKKQKTQL